MPSQPGRLVGIDLDIVVTTATRAVAADIAKRLGSRVGTRRRYHPDYPVKGVSRLYSGGKRPHHPEHGISNLPIAFGLGNRLDCYKLKVEPQEGSRMGRRRTGFVAAGDVI
jgi:hypothetical protein